MSLRLPCAWAMQALNFISLSALAAEAGPDHAAELETVVVTASPIGDADRLATIAGSVSRDQLLRHGAATLADALSGVPGVTSSGFAAGAGRPVIRGMDANRVRVLEGGIGSFDVSDVGPDHGVPIDPFAAERVEVVRGAATLRYGSQAIGGVVNAISQRVPTRLPDASPAGEISAGYSSGARGHDLAGQLRGHGGQFAWHADAFTRDSGDYDTPEGVMANSWLQGAGGAVGGAWIGEQDRVGMGAVRYHSRYGIPGKDSHIDMQQDKLMLRSSLGLQAGAWHAITMDGGWADYVHHERDVTGAALSTFRDREWDLRGEAVAGRWGAFSESALGLQLQQRDFSALGEGREYLPPTRTRSRAAFGFAEAPLAANLRLQIGARLENVEVDGISPDDLAILRSFTPVSLAAGLVLDAGEAWRLGLSLSTAGRAPAQTELFARGPHDGPRTFETGDPSLGLERASSAELSLRWRGGRVHADGSLWITHFDDYIHGALTGRSCDEDGHCAAGDAGELKELFYAQQDALFRGAEAHAEIELLQRASGDLHLTLQADVVRATFNAGGNVPRIPPWHATAGVTWQAARVDAAVSVKYSARQSDTGAGETATADFISLDAQLGWRPWATRPDIELALVGRNLADTVQRNAVALNKDEVLLPGRDVRLMIRARFN